MLNPPFSQTYVFVVILFDPSLTISLYPDSFYWPASLHTSLSLSIYLLYIYFTQNSSLLYRSTGVIQSKLHRHCNQSHSLSCCLSLSWRKTDVWDVNFLSFTKTPAEVLRSESTVSCTIYFVLWEAPMLNEIKNNLARLLSPHKPLR